MPRPENKTVPQRGKNHTGSDDTAFVPGQAAEGFRFTSALPVQVLKGMAPILTPYLEPAAQTGCGLPPPAAQVRLR